MHRSLHSFGRPYKHFHARSPGPWAAYLPETLFFTHSSWRGLESWFSRGFSLVFKLIWLDVVGGKRPRLHLPCVAVDRFACIHDSWGDWQAVAASLSMYSVTYSMWTSRAQHIEFHSVSLWLRLDVPAFSRFQGHMHMCVGNFASRLCPRLCRARLLLLVRLTQTVRAVSVSRALVRDRQRVQFGLGPQVSPGGSCPGLLPTHTVTPVDHFTMQSLVS